MSASEPTAKSKKVRTDRKPADWMLAADPDQVRASMVANRDLWIAAAMFDNVKGRDRESSLSLIMSASDLERADTVAKWRHEIEACYPGRQTPGADSPHDLDDKARSYYLQEALHRLLNIVDAPNDFKADVSRILRSARPKQAEKRGRVQAVLIDKPELASRPSALAKEAGCCRRLVDRYLQDGSVQVMP